MMNKEGKYLSCAAQNMRLTLGESRLTAHYDSGIIKQINIAIQGRDEKGNDICSVEVIGEKGTVWSWQSASIYYTGCVMYGVPITRGGEYLFVPTFTKGLLCLSLQDGHIVWKSKRKGEYSHTLVGEKTLCTARSKSEIELIDIENG